jgi:phytanoyl-CoA dioxygenase PhyH
MDRIFTHLETEEEFRRKGYIVLPLLSADEINALQQIHDSVTPSMTGDIFSTPLSHDYEYRRSVLDGIRPIVQHKLKRIFPYHKLAMAVFVTKRPTTTAGKLPIHQDWWITDNNTRRAVHVWCPLVDVDAQSACLKVVAASHRLLKNPYPIHPKYRTEYHSSRDLLDTMATSIPMTAGWAAVYDQRLLHGSGENLSNRTRVALNCIMIPEDAKPLLYCWDGKSESRLDIVEVNEDYLCRFKYGEPLEESYSGDVRYLKSIDVKVKPLQRDDICLLRKLQDEIMDFGETVRGEDDSRGGQL